MSRRTQDTTTPARTCLYGIITLCDVHFHTLPVRSYHRSVVLQPPLCRNIEGLGSFPFAHHYSGNRFFFLFLQVLRCFSSLGMLLKGDRSSTCRVSPFGYLRIDSCLPIPADFRSLPRPSSPMEAKASSVRSYLLRLESLHKDLLRSKSSVHEIVVPQSSEKPDQFQTIFCLQFFTSLSLSILSMN